MYFSQWNLHRTEKSLKPLPPLLPSHYLECKPIMAVAYLPVYIFHQIVNPMRIRAVCHVTECWISRNQLTAGCEVPVCWMSLSCPQVFSDSPPTEKWDLCPLPFSLGRQMPFLLYLVYREKTKDRRCEALFKVTQQAGGKAKIGAECNSKVWALHNHWGIFFPTQGYRGCMHGILRVELKK